MEDYMENNSCFFAIYTSKETGKKAIDLITHVTQYQNLFLHIPKFTTDEGSADTKIITFSDIPDPIWFSLFIEQEKIVSGDNRTYYGTSYETVISKALERIDQIINDSKYVEIKQYSLPKRTLIIPKKFSYFESLSNLRNLLSIFQKTDRVLIYFIYPEWPSIEEMESKNFVENFQSRLLVKIYPPRNYDTTLIKNDNNENTIFTY